MRIIGIVLLVLTLAGCTGDRIMVDKITYRFGSPRPGENISAVPSREG